MLMSRSFGYAIRGILYLTSRYQVHRKNIGIVELASELKIPQHFLGKIMQDLVKHEIINSVKGPNGGFYPHENTMEIKLVRVVEAVEGLNIFRKCQLGLNYCSEEKPCPVHFRLKEYRTGIRETFENTSLADMIADPQGLNAFLQIS